MNGRHGAGRGGNSKIRVLWLIKGLDQGGAERLVVHLGNVRDQKRFHPEVGYLIPARSALVPELEASGIPVRCLSNGRSLDLRWAAELRRWLIDEPFDILHMHLRHPATVARIVARSLPESVRPKLVFTEHNIWGADNPVTRWTNALTYRLDDATLAVSPVVHQSLPKWARRRAEVLVHGVDIAEITAVAESRDAVRAELGIDDRTVVVGTISNLRPQKGYDTLLRAARLLADSDLNVVFLSVGHGTHEATLRALHEKLGLGATFRFLGQRPDAIRVASAFDIFVLASNFEGFPVAIMEALVLGLPIVATDVGGVSQAIRDGREGYVVSARRPEVLAEKIRRLALDPQLRGEMSKAARARGRDFDIRNASSRIEDIYVRLLRGEHPTRSEA